MAGLELATIVGIKIPFAMIKSFTGFTKVIQILYADIIGTTEIIVTLVGGLVFADAGDTGIGSTGVTIGTIFGDNGTTGRSTDRDKTGIRGST